MEEISKIDFQRKYNYDESTQVMKQYLDIKYSHIDCLLMFRMGDFYELFFEDAVTASRILGIALTKRGRTGEQEIAMCGIPHHALEPYLHKLIEEGFKIAICDQLETPEEAKKRGGYKAVVQREVIRIITAGTITEDSLLNSGQPNYLISVVSDKDDSVISALDLSTSDFFVITVPEHELLNEIVKLSPKEVLISDKYRASNLALQISQLVKKNIVFQVDSFFIYTKCLNRILDFYHIHDISGIGNFSKNEVSAIGSILEYVSLTQKSMVKSLPKPRINNFANVMGIDASTRKNLELFANAAGEESGSLFHILNNTVTKNGQRLLYQYLNAPLLDVEKINIRLSITEFFYDHPKLILAIREALAGTVDLERCVTRVSMGKSLPRDLLSIKNTINIAEKMLGDFVTLCCVDLPPYILKITKSLIGLDDLYQGINKIIRDDAPNNLDDGGVIKNTYHPRVAELQSLIHNGNDKIEALKEKYRLLTGIENLKISSNNVLGLFIDVTTRNGSKMSSDIFIHRQSTANSVRYTTAELRELESGLVNAKASLLSLERELYDSLCAEIMENKEALSKLAYSLTVLDVYCNFATIAKKYEYTKPIVSDDFVFKLEEARHPVIEQILSKKQQSFESNDCHLDLENRIWLITGPNMGGKSTFLRQNALIAILAQIGSFVPAKRAEIGIFDKIFSRIGAGDDLGRGHSTFMTEMLESSTILSQATPRSLIILDEVGRGTSTYDGVSIAWAILEHIHDKLKSRCLFATHYHELVTMESLLSALHNFTVDIHEDKGNIIFLHKIRPGFADKSYGVHVAQLAGLPASVINRAKIILHSLEKNNSLDGGNKSNLAAISSSMGSVASNEHLVSESDLAVSARDELYDVKNEIYMVLGEINPDILSPKEALDYLYKLKTIQQNI